MIRYVNQQKIPVMLIIDRVEASGGPKRDR